jgi:hypothetical protein
MFDDVRYPGKQTSPWRAPRPRLEADVGLTGIRSMQCYFSLAVRPQC